MTRYSSAHPYGVDSRVGGDHCDSLLEPPPRSSHIRCFHHSARNSDIGYAGLVCALLFECTGLDPHGLVDGDEGGVALQRLKALNGSTTRWERGTTGAFVGRRVSYDEAFC